MGRAEIDTERRELGYIGEIRSSSLRELNEDVVETGVIGRRLEGKQSTGSLTFVDRLKRPLNVPQLSACQTMGRHKLALENPNPVPMNTRGDQEKSRLLLSFYATPSRE